MEQPIHSRGTGRSGPKRKTGCLTCRRRKVRCDEEKPVCANCIRLRLDCGYTSPKTKYVQLSYQLQPRPSTDNLNADAKTAWSTTSQQAGFSGLPSMANRAPQPAMPPPAAAQYESMTQQWHSGGPFASAYAQPFQDIFFSSLDSFNAGVDFVNSDAFLGPQLYTGTNGNPRVENLVNGSSHSISGANDDDQRCKALVEHFVQSTNPISVILPTDTEWNSACRSLLAMGNESASLLSAICSLSALHLHIKKDEDSVDEAFRCYKTSSRSISAVLDNPEVEDRELKSAFATIFLLAHVELMAQTIPTSKELDWSLQYLQSAHHRVRQHSDRIRLWTGTSKRLLTWMTLLQTKAEYNSGNPALQHSGATLSKSTGDPYARKASSLAVSDSSNVSRNIEYGQESSIDLTSADAEDDTRTMAEVAYDTMNQPGFDFFLKAQEFTSRIISLDRYHRTRGTLETEFETLKDGQKISEDLHTLWATRPTTMSFLRDPKGLEEALQPKLAKKVLLNLRVYVANFYAQFIYLHRVAFKTYPSTADVTSAIAQIISLAKEIVNSGSEDEADREIWHTSNGTFQNNVSFPSAPTVRKTTSQATSQGDQSPELEPGLPATMLWPLFLAAIEGTPSDQEFLLQAMREMDVRRVTNAARTIFLLEEVLRRQDLEGRRIDHRSVRQDLFEGELSVLY